ncbi:MAG: hypothetical protein Q8O14_12885 [bacterium]|nr:hypothetical protein [bacterium]
MTKMTRKGLINMLGEDEAAFMQLLKTKLIQLMATDNLDTVQLARDEMANRGLGTNGEWIGFPAAKKLWQAPAAAAQPGADDATIDAGLAALANIHCGFETLEARNMDALDFHEVCVLSLKDALRAAFELGRASK